MNIYINQINKSDQNQISTIKLEQALQSHLPVPDLPNRRHEIKTWGYPGPAICQVAKGGFLLSPPLLTCVVVVASVALHRLQLEAPAQRLHRLPAGTGFQWILKEKHQTAIWI